MPIIQELSQRQTLDCLAEASARKVPLTFSFRQGKSWQTVHSHIIRLLRDRLYLEYPQAEQGQPPEVTAGMTVGVAFKIRHHKHIFGVTVTSVSDLAVDGREAKVVCVPLPTTMQRVQRRAYNRVDVPKNRSVLAVFCQGGSGAHDGRRLTWDGWVTNISAGGFQVRLPSHAAPQLDVGDVVGVKVELGQEYATIHADAQFRHLMQDDRGTLLMGFQFVGLNETNEGRQTLRHLGDAVCDFQRLQGKRADYEHHVA